VDSALELFWFGWPHFFCQTRVSLRSDCTKGLPVMRNGPASWPHYIVAPIFSWRKNRIAIQSLEALNDHFLLDIGIERFDIPSFVYNGQKKDETSQ